MAFGTKLRHLPPRIAAASIILNSGLDKRGADEETAKTFHGMASGAYPQVAEVEPTRFVKLLSTGEIALGAALLTPFIPTALAGAGLAAFSAGLLGLYYKTPGMRQEGSLRPTPQGLAVAKDVWMFGIAVGLLTDVLGDD